MNRKKLSGFTLIELTVVLLVLIALAGLAIPYVSGTSSKALCDATDVSMQNIKRVIMDRYYLDTLGHYPVSKDGSDYNLKYLFEQGGWQNFDPDTQLGWRGPYLNNAAELSVAPDSSFQDDTDTDGTPIYVHTPVSLNQSQVLDAWGRPIIIQAYCSDPAHTTKSDCEANDKTWIGRLVSAGRGSGVGLENGVLDTPISGNRSGDDRVLYLQTTPAGEENPSCD